MNEPKEFTCPNCAETVKFEARACRFCGQALNGAVKQGFPEFYTKVAMHDLSLDWLLTDYVNHVLPGDYGGALTAPLIIGNLLHSGTLNEYEEFKLVREAIEARETELTGRSADWDLPEPTSVYWLEAKPELRALRLVRKYLELASDYTKLFSGKDSREEPKNFQHAIVVFGKLIELAESADPPMQDFAAHFREEIETCREHLAELEQRQSIAVEDKRIEENHLNAHRSSRGDSSKVKVWAIVVGIGIVVFIFMF